MPERKTPKKRGETIQAESPSYYRSSINTLVFLKTVLADRLDNLESFMNPFMTWYNHLRKHQGLGRIPLEVLS